MNSVVFTRHNFRVCVGAGVDGETVIASPTLAYFVRFSIKQVDAPNGTNWVLLVPPTVEGDNQAGLGSTPLSWDLQ